MSDVISPSIHLVPSSELADSCMGRASGRQGPDSTCPERPVRHSVTLTDVGWQDLDTSAYTADTTTPSGADPTPAPAPRASGLTSPHPVGGPAAHLSLAQQAREAQQSLATNVRRALVIHRDLMLDFAANEPRADEAAQYRAEAQRSVRELEALDA